MLAIGGAVTISGFIIGLMLFGGSSKSNYTDVTISTDEVVVKDIRKGYCLDYEMLDTDANGRKLKYRMTIKTPSAERTLVMPDEMGELKKYYGIVEAEFSLMPNQGPKRAVIRLTDYKL